MIVTHLIIKEFKQMLRNRILPIVFIILPIALVNGIPRLATQEIKGLKFCVVDHDYTPTSQRLVQQIDASQYLDLSASCATYAQAMEHINDGTTDIIIEINDNKVMLSANSTNGTKGSMASMYIQQIIGLQASDTMHQDSNPINYKPLTISQSFLFNPNLDYKLYMVPAILGMILILIVGFLPALNIVGEKEKGTIEQINVTPIHKWHFIVSKIVPYVMVGIVMMVEGLLVARGVYGFWPKGSLALIFLSIILFCMLVSSFGLIISNYSSTLQQAALTMFFFLVIFLLMSGLLTPIQSMPDWAQKITYINPMRYFVEAIRAIYIKGTSLSGLSFQFAILFAYSCLTWTWAIISYRKNN